MHNNKTIFIALIVFLAVAMFNLPCFAQTTEQLDITTYYPSPTGVYQQLRLFPKDFDTTAICNGKEGTLAFHATDNALYVCDGTGQWKRVDRPTALQPAGWITVATGLGDPLVHPTTNCTLNSLISCPDSGGFNCQDSDGVRAASFHWWLAVSKWYCAGGSAVQLTDVHCCFPP
jgi:hypothetical protein